MSADLQTRLEAAIAPGDRLLLDSSVAISYFDGDDRWAEAAKALIEGLVRPGRNPGVVSALTVMESLVGPMRRVPPGHRTALDFFASNISPRLRLNAPVLSGGVAVLTCISR